VSDPDHDDSDVAANSGAECPECKSNKTEFTERAGWECLECGEQFEED